MRMSHSTTSTATRCSASSSACSSDTPGHGYRGVQEGVAAHARRELSGFRELSKSTNALMSRVALVERARYSIDPQHCIFKNDAAGRLLAPHLLDAADPHLHPRLAGRRHWPNSPNECVFQASSEAPRICRPIIQRCNQSLFVGCPSAAERHAHAWQPQLPEQGSTQQDLHRHGTSRVAFLRTTKKSARLKNPFVAR